MLVETSGVPKSSKKLVIRSLKQRPSLPPDFEVKTWQKLNAAIFAVQHAEKVGVSLEELYQAVESMCVHKLGESLYTRVRQVCDAHIAASLSEMSQHVGKAHLDFLAQMHDVWRRHCEQMQLIRSIFLYLDRSVVRNLSDENVRGLYDMGLQQFRTHLEAHQDVCQKVVDGILDLLQRHRSREAVDVPLLKALVAMLRDLGIYEVTFVDPMLTAARAHYTAEGEAMCASMSVAQHLQASEDRIAEESARCRDLLDPDTLAPLTSIVRDELLRRHWDALLSRGLRDLLQQRADADLARLYRLAAQVDKLASLRIGFQEYMTSTGTALVSAPEADAAVVPGMMSLKSDMDAVLKGPFQGDDAFAKAVREAFEKFINSRESKTAELIAKFVDAKMKGGSRDGSEAQLDEQLDQLLVLFRYVQGKDVFEAFYKKDFAKRLLMGRSASIDVEKGLIAKLKAECGAQYTSKLEGMFKDEQLSKDIAQAFKGAADAQAQLPAGLDFNVRVLTSGFWPTYPVMSPVLPDFMREARQVFETFYLAKHGGRRLQWHSNVEQCTVRAFFPRSAVNGIPKPKELQVSLHQALVLLLFNDTDSLSFGEIEAALQLPDGELRRTLQSLANGKVRVLKKDPKGKDIEDSDTFHFNADFTHGMFKIKINQIQMKETAEENKKTNEQVLQDRQYQIDAAIVRTMKTRKQLSHKLLINEVITQLRFSIKASDLKKRIENLIEREYMERAEGTLDVYTYLA